MKQWLDPIERSTPTLVARPICYVEDVVADVFTFLRALTEKELVEGDILEACTIVLIAELGNDTRRDTIDLLCKYPRLQVVALPPSDGTKLRPLLEAACKAVNGSHPKPPGEVAERIFFNKALPGAATAAQRYADLERAILSERESFKAAIERLVRPGGLVVCDLELEPLRFGRTGTPTDDLLNGAQAVGRVCMTQAAQLSIFSSVKVFLSVAQSLRRRDVEVDDRLVYVKGEDLGVAAQTISRLLRTRFPLHMTVRQSSDTPQAGLLEYHRVGHDDLAYAESYVDLLLWPEKDRTRARGRALPPGGWEFAQVPTAALEMLVKGHLNLRRQAVLKTDFQADRQTPEQIISNLKDWIRNSVIPKGAEAKYQLAIDRCIGSVSAIRPAARTS